MPDLRLQSMLLLIDMTTSNKKTSLPLLPLAIFVFGGAMSGVAAGALFIGGESERPGAAMLTLLLGGLLSALFAALCARELERSALAEHLLGELPEIGKQQMAATRSQHYRDFLETVLQHIPHPVFVKNSQREYVAVNRAFCDLVGVPADQLLGRSAIENLRTSRSLSRQIAAMDERVFAGEGTQCDEYVLPLVSGQRTILSRKVLASDPEGSPIMIGALTDITELRQAEAEIKQHRDDLSARVAERTAEFLQAKNAAEAASEAKSEFLANMSHELRTPLHAVLGFAQLGIERASSDGQEKLAHYYQRIQQSGQRLLTLLNNLLDLAKLEAGMMKIAPRVQPLLPLLQEAIAEFEGLAVHRGIRLEIIGECAEAAVDASAFAQVMRNLLSNALKFSPENACVRIELSPTLLPRGRRTTDMVDVPALQIVVHDQGIGIPESELEHIFDKFVQSSHTRSGAGGTGLGLAISRQIVLAHFGTIHARNNPQGGAALVVVLPCEHTRFICSGSEERSA